MSRSDLERTFNNAIMKKRYAFTLDISMISLVQNESLCGFGPVTRGFVGD